MMSCISSPAWRHQPPNSAGRMNLAYSCVPRGSMRSTYSAPTMAKAKDLALRLMVEKHTWPPGLTRVAQARITEAGSGTCSSISMQVTTSKRPGCRVAISSAVHCWYSTSTPDSSWCRRATDRGASPMSIPVTRAPRWAMASVRMPPPQPTSSASLPASEDFSSIQLVRSGLISCSGLNSLSRSHQRLARASNLAISARSTFSVIMIPLLHLPDPRPGAGFECVRLGLGPARPSHGQQYTLSFLPLAATFARGGRCGGVFRYGPEYNDVFPLESFMQFQPQGADQRGVQAMEWRGDSLRILDHRRLPEEHLWIDCTDAPQVAAAIRDGVVQGPASVGIAAAYGIALAARRLGQA